MIEDIKNAEQILDEIMSNLQYQRYIREARDEIRKLLLIGSGIFLRNIGGKYNRYRQLKVEKVADERVGYLVRVQGRVSFSRAWNWRKPADFDFLLSKNVVEQLA